MKTSLLYLFLFLIFNSCSSKETLVSVVSPAAVSYKQRMRDLVMGLSSYTKSIHPNFKVIPQNGIQLITTDGMLNSPLVTDYLDAIDGIGQEVLFYGYSLDDQATLLSDTNRLRSYLDLAHSAQKTIMVTDYCSTAANVIDSYQQNAKLNYISFAADQRLLTDIPAFPNPVYNQNSFSVRALGEARNFLYLINPSTYLTKADFIAAVTASNYDLLVMDLFFQDGTPFTAEEISHLKNKANGGKRLVLSYLSVGEAEIYRYYWQSSWNNTKPSWLDAENPNWPGNFKVKYWDPEWQKILFGNDASYSKKILDTGFDGVYLDIIDAFEYYQ